MIVSSNLAFHLMVTTTQSFCPKISFLSLYRGFPLNRRVKSCRFENVPLLFDSVFKTSRFWQQSRSSPCKYKGWPNRKQCCRAYKLSLRSCKACLSHMSGDFGKAMVCIQTHGDNIKQACVCTRLYQNGTIRHLTCAVRTSKKDDHQNVNNWI